MKKKNIWLKNPEGHDFPAAADYLELLFENYMVEPTVERLRRARTEKKKAKDILRASGLPLLPKKNVHVKHNVDKVKKGEKMSPVLLARWEGKLIVADGYHRVCASYYLSEDLEVPCRLTSIHE